MCNINTTVVFMQWFSVVINVTGKWKRCFHIQNPSLITNMKNSCFSDGFVSLFFSLKIENLQIIKTISTKNQKDLALYMSYLFPLWNKVLSDILAISPLLFLVLQFLVKETNITKKPVTTRGNKQLNQNVLFSFLYHHHPGTDERAHNWFLCWDNHHFWVH